MTTHVLFEGEPGVIVDDGDVIIEGVELADLVKRAANAARDADRVELCGGVGVDDAARVIEVIGGGVEVRVNRYGFESLEQVTAYKASFETGEAGGALFLYGATVSTPLARHEGVVVAGVADREALIERVREARGHGVGIVELYGGLGASAAADVRDAVDGALPVGFID
ncbi:DUF6506 family protein [Nocardiopsis alba]|uniref:DUF6506 family protein n=1 Tax=Nocardiopsis alba TaxID=53437 RepID=UPI0034110261